MATHSQPPLTGVLLNCVDQSVDDGAGMQNFKDDVQPQSVDYYKIHTQESTLSRSNSARKPQRWLG